MKLERRVILAHEAAMKGDMALALDMITAAIDATAQKKSGKAKSNREDYKALLREYYDILERFIGEGLDLAASRFPDITLKSEGGKTHSNPDFADIVYHAFRCALAHGQEVDEEFTFLKSEALGVSTWVIGFEDGRIHMPDKVIWGLIAVVVFCDANKGIETDTDAWLIWGSEDPSIGRHRFEIDDFWGEEETVRKFFAERPAVRVAFDPKV